MRYTIYHSDKNITEITDFVFVRNTHSLLFSRYCVLGKVVSPFDVEGELIHYNVFFISRKIFEHHFIDVSFLENHYDKMGGVAALRDKVTDIVTNHTYDFLDENDD